MLFINRESILCELVQLDLAEHRHRRVRIFDQREVVMIQPVRRDQNLRAQTGILLHSSITRLMLEAQPSTAMTKTAAAVSTVLEPVRALISRSIVSLETTVPPRSTSEGGRRGRA